MNNEPAGKTLEWYLSFETKMKMVPLFFASNSGRGADRGQRHAG